MVAGSLMYMYVYLTSSFTKIIGKSYNYFQLYYFGKKTTKHFKTATEIGVKSDILQRFILKFFSYVWYSLTVSLK